MNKNCNFFPHCKNANFGCYFVNKLKKNSPEFGNQRLIKLRILIITGFVPKHTIVSRQRIFCNIHKSVTAENKDFRPSLAIKYLFSFVAKDPIFSQLQQDRNIRQSWQKIKIFVSQTWQNIKIIASHSQKKMHFHQWQQEFTIFVSHA